ncbi:pancreatic lipase-related protein 2-like [Trichoplusia ni]|uniref:Pancreatic lipase-related protein 2-like n=1 Tax=Trichoplusia ni TaxID=7111 RepID=A0A7E5VJT3_TRINI|nr:pancreatic lipase-related protein 2-like [Trichoplusia ni]
MSRFILFLTLTWLATTAAQFGIINKIKKGVTKEISAVVDPIEKTIVYVGFSQCKHVKRILGVDYESYNNTEPDLSLLSLNFMTREVNVSFLLTTAASLLPKAGWLDPRKPLKIYLHGFTDDPTKNSYSNISRAFLSQGDYNILALDASSLIRWLYLRSSTMVRFIGEELGQILAVLVRAGLNPSAIHLIGHSLGTHISSFTGKRFTELTGFRVGRITGLDPAGPCFSDVEPNLRLNRNDADFVDVIHTDAGTYGIHESVGHVDFFPNSGSTQPGCLPALLLATCSHSRAWLLYAESVNNPQAFVAAPCASWKDFRKGNCDFNRLSLMGYGCPPGTTGTYYLQTSDAPPFGRGMAGVHYVNQEGLLKNVGMQIGIN